MVLKICSKNGLRPQRGRDGGDDLGDEPVQVGVGGARQAKVLHGKLVDCLIENILIIKRSKICNLRQTLP